MRLHFYILYLLRTVMAECHPGEVLTPCKRPCERTCQNPTPPRCFYSVCSPGCVCQNGLVRDELSRTCLDPKSCPDNCANDEVENKLNACEPTCPTKVRSSSHLAEIKSCVCKFGLVRNLDMDKCIPLHECPNVCGENEILSNCTNTACRKTCQNKNEEILCTLACDAGCVCKDNYIWDEFQNKCVLEEECSPECGENEEYGECSDKLCKPTCDNIGQPIICPKICTHGCSCKPDYVYDKDQNKCIHNKTCSKNCKTNEEWSNCLNSCQETCHYPGKQFCTLECNSGCVCKKGFLWDKYKVQCVKKRDCSKLCSENQVWRDYIPGDLPTCQSLHEPIIIGPYNPTFVDLKPGCICESGFILNEDNGECVDLNDCLNGKLPSAATELSGTDAAKNKR